MSAPSGDLIYCIRAWQIDDKSLVAQVSVDEMADFSLYAKEIYSLAADARSVSSDRLCRIITANDLAGVSLFSDATFRNSLSTASKISSPVYPELARETLVLNLPPLLNALVTFLFLQAALPLLNFPPAVAKKIRFAKAPLTLPTPPESFRTTTDEP